MREAKSGFTLVELMMVIAVAGILMAIAIPNFLTWRDNYRFRKAVRDMYSNFQRARLAAIREHALGTIVFNQPIDGVNYDYVVFLENLTDANDNPVNRNVQYDTGEKILAKVKLSDYVNVEFDTAQGGGDGITFFKNKDDPAKPAVAFRPIGIPRSPNGGFGAGSVYFKNTKNGKAKGVVLARAGRVRTTETFVAGSTPP